MTGCLDNKKLKVKRCKKKMYSNPLFALSHRALPCDGCPEPAGAVGGWPAQPLNKHLQTQDDPEQKVML